LTLEQIIAESQDQIVTDKIEQMAQTIEIMDWEPEFHRLYDAIEENALRTSFNHVQDERIKSSLHTMASQTIQQTQALKQHIDANRDAVFKLCTRMDELESTQRTIVALLTEMKSELINRCSITTHASLPPSPVREISMLSKDTVQYPTSMAVRADVFRTAAPDSVRQEQEASQLTPSHHRNRLHNNQLTPTKRSPHVADYLAPCEDSIASPMTPFLKLPNETAFGISSTDVRFYPKITESTTWVDIFGLVKTYSQLWNAWRPFFLTEYRSCGDMHQHMYEGVALREPKVNVEGHYHVYYPPIAAVNMYFHGAKQWKSDSQTSTMQKFVSIVRTVVQRAAATSLQQAVQEIDNLKTEAGGWAKIKFSSELAPAEGDAPHKRRKLNEGVNAGILEKRVLAPGVVTLKIGKEQKSKNQQSPRGRKSVPQSDDTVFN